MSAYLGLQPISYLIFLGSVYRMGGSPGRRGDILTGIFLPLTRFATSTISSTVYGCPLPTL